MANKRISNLPTTTTLPDGSVFPVVMGDGTGTKQITKDDLKKEVGGDVPVATEDTAGIVKPDNLTCRVEEDGKLVVMATEGGSSGVILAQPSDVSITNFDQAAKISWTDPDDVVYQGATLASWAGTVVVRKEGSTPQTWNDGTVVARVTIRDQYKETPLIDGGLTNGVEYCYGIFPYSADEVYNTSYTQSFVPTEITPITPVINSAVGSDGVVTLNITSETADALVKVVYKAGSAPSSGSDGTVIDGLAAGELEISGLTNNTQYYFVAYAYTNLRTSSASAAVSATPKAYTLLGFKMKKSESSPSAKVEYTEGAVGLTPAAVNLTTREFDYGDFGDFWFVTQNKPVMVKSDGTEDYELDPNDYTKKLDGTASDVSNSSYDGNCMSKIPKTYLKMWEDDEYEYCNICDVKLDDDYHAYAHTRADGSEMDFIYLSAFEGSLVSNKVRSIKGLTPMNNQTGANELTYAKANGSLWSTRSWSQRNLINMLLILMAKTTDTQTAYGYGYYTGGSSSSPNYLTTGGASDKGQFYGTNATRNWVKVFHIENWWGDVWERIEGCVTNGSTHILVKSTPDYNTGGTGYTDTGVVPSGTSGGYISACKMTEDGLIPKVASGSETTHYTDGLWYMANCYALVGGASDDGFLGGALSLLLPNALSSAHWALGAALSCEQPIAA